MARDQRRLAAIVSADVAGYSRLMGQDDSSTLAALKAHRRELIDPKIAEYGGRIVNTTGDGLLLEFPSVVDAVRCAVDVQRGMAERNANVAADQRLEFRVGLNVGDIIIDGDDIYGDGVNVAARLQALAEPGAICVSKVVRDQVLDKLSFTFEDLGAQQVKNIARPVEVYRIRYRHDPTAAATAQSRRVTDRGRFLSRITRGAHSTRWVAAAVAVVVAGIAAWYVSVPPKALATATDPPLMSVAVMPFTPASTSAEDENFAEMITQDVTSAAERAMRSALVVSHGLAAKYKNKSIDPRPVGRDLDVRYLLEGDVRHVNGSVVIVARLVETMNGTQVWSGQQIASASTGSDDERDIVAQLTNRLREALYDAEEKRVANLPTAGASAADLALRAGMLWGRDPSPNGRIAARKGYEEALRLDPASVPALMGLYFTIKTQLFDDPNADHEKMLKEMDDVSLRATRADRDDPRVWQIRGDALALQWQWDGAFEANAQALHIDPYRNSALADRAELLILTGRSEEALPVLNQAIGLDPRSGNVPFYLQYQCSADLNLGRYDEAIAACEKAVALEDYWPRYAYLVAAYAQKGDTAKAAAAKAELLKRRPDLSIAGLKALRISNNSIFLQQLETHATAGLRKAGIPEQ